MKILKYLTMTVVTLVLSSNIALAQPQGHGQGGDPMFGLPPLQELELTSEQETQIKSLTDSYSTQLKTAMEEVHTAREALDSLVRAGSSDTDAIRAAAVTLGEALGEAAIIQAELTKMIKSYLTDDQLSQLEELRESRRNHAIPE